MRTPEENRRYMREYYRNNPDKYKRSPEWQKAHNDRRRKRYAEDAAFREQCKASARRRDPRARRNGRLLASFGISADEYDAMLAGQGGRCAICGSAVGDKWNRRLAVDHCHATGKVRGILCTNCNQGIGKFKDCADLLLRASKYIKAHADK